MSELSPVSLKFSYGLFARWCLWTAWMGVIRESLEGLDVVASRILLRDMMYLDTCLTVSISAAGPAIPI